MKTGRNLLKKISASLLAALVLAAGAVQIDEILHIVDAPSIVAVALGSDGGKGGKVNTGGNTSDGDTSNGTTGGNTSGGDTSNGTTGGDTSNGNTGGNTSDGDTSNGNTGGNTSGSDEQTTDEPSYKVDDAAVTIQASRIVYTGKSKTPSFEVRQGDTVLTEGTDYRVEYYDNTDAGKASAFIIGIGQYSGMYEVKFTIQKAANSMQTTARKVTTGAAALRKAAKTIPASRYVTVKKAKGKVSYSKASGSNRIRINTKTGKLTIRKGTPKGTYKVTVKVKAAGTRNYKSKTCTATVMVRVK